MELNISGIALSILPREILHCVQNDLFVAGILLCTREAEEFIMVWGMCLLTRVLFFNTRVARVRGVGVGRGGIGRVAVCGMCWRIVCNPEWSERSRG